MSTTLLELRAGSILRFEAELSEALFADVPINDRYASSGMTAEALAAGVRSHTWLWASIEHDGNAGPGLEAEFIAEMEPMLGLDLLNTMFGRNLKQPQADLPRIRRVPWSEIEQSLTRALGEPAESTPPRILEVLDVMRRAVQMEVDLFVVLA